MLSGKLLGVILAVREVSEEHVGCQGSFWEPCWLGAGQKGLKDTIPRGYALGLLVIRCFGRG